MLLTVRPGGGAAVGVVTELVNVHATLGVGIVARDIPGDGRWRGFRLLFEGHRARDLGVTAERCHWRQREVSAVVSKGAVV